MKQENIVAREMQNQRIETLNESLKTKQKSIEEMKKQVYQVELKTFDIQEIQDQKNQKQDEKSQNLLYDLENLKKYVKIFSNVPAHIDLVPQDCFAMGHDCQGNDCAIICLTCDKVILDIKNHYIVGGDNDNKCAMVCY